MREIFQQSPFKADFKRVSRSGRYKAEDVLGIIAMLANDGPLPERCRDHALTGEWKDFLQTNRIAQTAHRGTALCMSLAEITQDLFILARYVNVRLRVDLCCHALVTQIFLIRTMIVVYTLWGDFDNSRSE